MEDCRLVKNTQNSGTNYNESRTQFQLQEFHNSNNSITNYKMF